MCRSISEGGRRCPACSSGERRNAKDRLRYARRQVAERLDGVVMPNTSNTGVAGDVSSSEALHAAFVEARGRAVAAVDQMRAADEIYAVWMASVGGGLPDEERLEWLRANHADHPLFEVLERDALRGGDGKVLIGWSPEAKRLVASLVSTATDAVLEAGAAADLVILDRVGEPLAVDELDVRVADINAEVGRLMKIRFSTQDDDEAERVDALTLRLVQDRDDIRDEVWSERSQWAQAYAAEAKSLLASVRDVGVVDRDGLGLHPKTTKNIAEHVLEVADCFPAEWWERSAAVVDVEPTTRSFLEAADGVTKKISPKRLFVRYTKARAHYQSQGEIAYSEVKPRTEKVRTPDFWVDVPTFSFDATVDQVQRDGMKISKVRDPLTGKKGTRKIVDVEIDYENRRIRAKVAGSNLSYKVAGGEEDWRVTRGDIRPGTEILSAEEFLRRRAEIFERQKDYYGGGIGSVSLSGHDHSGRGRSATKWDATVIRVEYDDGRVESFARELPPPTYSEGTASEYVSTVTTDGSARCTTHELGHRFEHTVPGLTKLEQEFWDRRCKGKPLEKLFKGRKPEMGVPTAGFVSPYSSKVYTNSGHKEILSTGFEAVFAGSYGSLVGNGLADGAKDDQHRAFTLGTLLAA